MIKGVNHTIIEVSNPCNQYFERALLFVRPQWEQAKQQQLDNEADLFVKLIGSPPPHSQLKVSQQRKYSKIKRIIFHTCWWMVGVICGYLLHSFI